MAIIPSVLQKRVLAAERHKIPATGVSPLVVESAAMDAAGVYGRLNTRQEGLTADEATTLRQ
jgi:hypothetical protein